MIKEILSIFENLSKPFDSFEKKKEFIKIFDKNKIEYEWNEKIGFIIHSKKETFKTIVSHMDLIKKFNKGFKENKTFIVKEDKLEGALDNTLTNAILIYHIIHNQDENTNYLFTIDEETNQKSIEKYVKEYGINQFYINLDITNEGFSNNMSIEYDDPSFEICKQLNNNLNNPYFTKYRVCDDLDGVLKLNGSGLSYCIPSMGNIHSYKNYTHISKIKPYFEGLEYMIKKMSLENYTPNLQKYSIDFALAFKDIDSIKSNPLQKRELYKKKEKANFNSPLKNYNEFSKEFLTFIEDNELMFENIDEFLHFIKTEDKISYTYCNNIFPTIDVYLLIDNEFFIDYVGSYLFNKDKIFKNNNFFEFIKEVLEFNKIEYLETFQTFLENLKKNELFSFEDTDEETENAAELLFTLYNYEIIKDIDNNKYILDFKFQKRKEYKIWEFIKEKYPTVSAINIFMIIIERKIKSIDIMNCEKNLNMTIANDLLRDLTTKKLLKIKKGGFKI